MEAFEGLVLISSGSDEVLGVLWRHGDQRDFGDHPQCGGMAGDAVASWGDYGVDGKHWKSVGCMLGVCGDTGFTWDHV